MDFFWQQTDFQFFVSFSRHDEGVRRARVRR